MSCVKILLKFPFKWLKCPFISKISDFELSSNLSELFKGSQIPKDWIAEKENKDSLGLYPFISSVFTFFY